ncbi:unnamed protein product [Candida verbasci]|uniref:ER membrane protein complex subunit 2 n=1 Tax=Candida verbasci TaxID=1227364 RepID=A0A9W4TYA5_9ASCO|nr:unnamed protein product [Candida verbasci]
MSVSYPLLKKKLLLIASSGQFAKFTSQQLLDTYSELNQFLLSYTSKLDSIELFNLYELNFYLAILTKNESDAKLTLDRLTDQFGTNSQRIKILQSIYQESIGNLKAAGDYLTENPDELQLSRRLTTLSRDGKYISNLIYYINLQPGDLIAWSELSSEYAKIGDYKKAIFCLKEIILVDKVAYPIHYKIGLYYYYIYLQEKETTRLKKEKLIELVTELKHARDYFLYCIEINEGYGKAWVGLNQILNLDIHNKAKEVNDKDIKKITEDNERIKGIVNDKVKLYI